MELRKRLFSVTVVILLVTLVLLVSTSCIRIVGFRGSGNVVTEKRDVQDFNSVSVSTGINLFIEQGGDEELIIEAEDNIMSKITTDVKDGKLEIGFKWNTFGGLDLNKPVKVYLTVIELEEIDVSSGAEVQSEELKTDKLKVDISSGAAAELIVEAQNLDIALSSGSNLEISGKAANQKVDLSSGVDYDAGELESKTVNIDVSSGGSAVIWATDKLDVSISSGGSVKYKGSPEIISDISSGGSIKSISD
jgi:hypothetical protein